MLNFAPSLGGSTAVPIEHGSQPNERICSFAAQTEIEWNTDLRVHIDPGGGCPEAPSAAKRESGMRGER